jgi:TPR repeat protein
MYHQGLGVVQDHAEAVMWYRSSAAQGLAAAQYDLAYMYYHGLGVSRDFVEAAAWVMKSAEQGHVSAQYDLGYMYAHGEGVAEDAVRAYMFYALAAEAGDIHGRQARDEIAVKMTPQQIDEAQELVRAWTQTHR